jgi:hypothetical protein
MKQDNLVPHRITSVSKINNQAPSYPLTSSNDARDIQTNNPRVDSSTSGYQALRILSTIEVKVSNREHKELAAGREYYLTVMMPENHEANRITMLNIFNTRCYGPLQTIVTNYYAEIDNIGFVKDQNGVGKWDKIDFELL